MRGTSWIIIFQDIFRVWKINYNVSFAQLQRNNRTCKIQRTAHVQQGSKQTYYWDSFNNNHATEWLIHMDLQYNKKKWTKTVTETWAMLRHFVSVKQWQHTARNYVITIRGIIRPSSILTIIKKKNWKYTPTFVYPEIIQRSTKQAYRGITEQIIG